MSRVDIRLRDAAGYRPEKCRDAWREDIARIVEARNRSAMRRGSIMSICVARFSAGEDGRRRDGGGEGVHGRSAREDASNWLEFV